MSNKNSSKPPRFILYIILFVILLLIGISGYKVYDYLKEQNEAQKSITQLSNKAVTLSETTKSDGEYMHKEAEAVPPPCPITVDFEALRKENNDIIAWLYLPDTVINYPVLQADDNEYYVRRLTNGYWNIAGSIFADCRNASDFSDPNTVIYGHNMTNDTMFGTLMDYRSQEYYDAHPYMYIITPEKKYRLELLTGFVTLADSEVYSFPQTAKETEEKLLAWLEASDFEPAFEYTRGSKLATLSTCAENYGNKRYVVIGALKETE